MINNRDIQIMQPTLPFSTPLGTIFIYTQIPMTKYRQQSYLQACRSIPTISAKAYVKKELLSPPSAPKQLTIQESFQNAFRKINRSKNTRILEKNRLRRSRKKDLYLFHKHLLQAKHLSQFCERKVMGAYAYLYNLDEVDIKIMVVEIKDSLFKAVAECDFEHSKLRHIFVEPFYRNQGIGTSLLKLASEKLPAGGFFVTNIYPNTSFTLTPDAMRLCRKIAYQPNSKLMPCEDGSASPSIGF